MRRLAPTASAVLAALISAIVSPPVARACPVCKDAVAVDSGVAAGYNWSVLLLAGMPFLLIALIAMQTAQALNPEAFGAVRRRLRAMWRPRTWALLAGGLLALGGATYLTAPAEAAATLRWQPAAVAGLKELNGTGLVQAADLTDRVVVVTFFATWCAPCREQVVEAAQLRRLFLLPE